MSVMNLSNQSIKFSLLLISIFIVLVASFAEFGLERLNNHKKETIRESLQTVLVSNHKTIYLWIDQRKLDIENIAKNTELVKLTANLIYEHQGRIKPLYVSTIAQLKEYLSSEIKEKMEVEFYIISKNRRTVASNKNKQKEEINPIHIQAKNHLDSVFSGKTVYIKMIDSNNEHSYFIVAPIQNLLGVTFAAIAIKINPSREFSDITELGRLGDSGETYAFNEDGVLITKSRFDDLADKNRVAFSNEEIELRLKEKRMPTSESGFDVDGYINYRGATVMGAWLWDKTLGFGLATEIEMSEGMQSYHEIKNIVIIVLFLTTLLSITLFVLIKILQIDSEKKLKKAHAELEQRVFERTRELQDAKNKLTSVNKKLEELSITDGLTGISNRRNFDLHYDNEWKRCVREEKSVTIIMFDIDYFKKYNDTYGHQKGDDCIRAIGTMLKTTDLANRPGDLIARYGGEEFIVLLVDASINYSNYISNKIHSSVKELKIPHETSEVGNVRYVTVSVGYAREESVEKIKPADLIKYADEALYKAKEQGRNQVVCHFPADNVSILKS